MVSDLDNGHEQVDFRLKWILSSVKFNKQAHAFYSFRWIEVHPYKTQIRKGLYAKSRTTCGLFEIALWPTENVFMTRLRWYHTDFPQSAMQTTAKHFSGGLAHPSMLLNCHLQFDRHLARRYSFPVQSRRCCFYWTWPWKWRCFGSKTQRAVMALTNEHWRKAERLLKSL